jgi:hypothetical protein
VIHHSVIKVALLVEGDSVGQIPHSSLVSFLTVIVTAMPAVQQVQVGKEATTHRAGCRGSVPYALPKGKKLQ